MHTDTCIDMCPLWFVPREDNDEYRLKLSDVYFTLGEVALESGMPHECAYLVIHVQLV